MADKEDKVLKKKQRQIKEQATRDHIRQLYEQQDAMWRERYALELLAIGRQVEVRELDEEPKPPVTGSNPNQASISAQDSLLDVGKVYEVNVTVGKKTQTYQAHFTGEGFHPESALEASAMIDTLALKGRASSILLYVAKEPYFPKDAAETLAAWTQMCITKGLAAELDKKTAAAFMATPSGDKDVEKLKDKVRELIAISELRLAETKMNAAAHPNKSWLDSDTQILNEQEKTSVEKIDTLKRDLLDGATLTTDEIDVKVTAAELQELQDRFKQLELMKNRLAEVEAAEKAILAKPELLAKADNVSFELKEGQTEKEIADKAIKGLGKDVSQKKIDEKIDSVNNRPDLIDKKDKLITAIEKEGRLLETRMNELDRKVENNQTLFIAQKTELDKLKPTMNAAISVDGKLAQDLVKLRDWNSNGRNTAVTAAKAPVQPLAGPGNN